MKQETFINLVREMRKAQKAYYVNFSPVKKAPKEELERCVDKALKDFEQEEKKNTKQEPKLF